MICMTWTLQPRRRCIQAVTLPQVTLNLLEGLLAEVAVALETHPIGQALEVTLDKEELHLIGEGPIAVAIT